MPTPSQGYRLRDGTRVPGTTTIISRFKDSGPLIKWAYKQGREHEALASAGKPAPSDLYQVTQAAADIGTVVHSMVEESIKGNKNPTSIQAFMDLPLEDMKKAKSGFAAYQAWASITNMEIVEQEVQLVSEKYRFGGTPDAIGKVNGKLCLLDWKTSNALYSDHLIQLAAYRALWEENHPDKPLHGYHLCRFSKSHGDFAHHYYSALDEAWRMFVLMREAYEIDKELKKRAA